MNITALICLLALIALLVIAIIARVAVSKKGGGRIAQYAPPRGMNLLMAGVLTRTEKTAVPAQLVDLAVKKNLRFIAPDAAGERMRIELLDGPSLDGDEYALLGSLFGAQHSSERVRKILRRDVKLGRALRALLNGVAERLEQQGFVGSRRRWLTVLLRWVAALVAIVYLIAMIAGPDTAMWAVFGMLALGVLIAFYATMPQEWRVYPPRSFEVRDHLAGLYDYIALAEADRLRFLQSPQGALRSSVSTVVGRVEVLALNEKLLPYAVLFGLEKDWMKQLEVEYRELQAAGAFDGLDALIYLSLLGDLGEIGGLAELLGGLDLGDLDFSGLDLPGIDLGDIDLGDFSIDL